MTQILDSFGQGVSLHLPARDKAGGNLVDSEILIISGSGVTNCSSFC